MAYPAGHRTAVKKKIVDSARRLFNRHGFENVSLSQIMAGAGLTHGGFYSYFNSKSELYAEVLGCFFTDPDWESCWDGVEVDLSSTDVGAQVVRAYLSRQHFEDVENSCPMVALPTDVGRSGEVARARLRNRVQGDGQRIGAKHGPERPAAAHYSSGHRGPFDRGDDRGPHHRRSGPCRRVAGGMHGRRAGPGRMEPKEVLDGPLPRKTQMARVAPGHSHLKSASAYALAVASAFRRALRRLL